ncbi:hypothetical protein Asp14428_57650 [Actinoplanes sp. NBRC 14428]|uniref:Antitoxin Xre/MbcA/ParS-like toxin-binding domain-containing protein n=1 Tax=Pseudosporangium ferrugineum TaxID=439699 RepID=A0A2T0SDS2_9ACTN|nr:hypothetical protein [Pseudosporangium ferrugineum]PRY31564.1 hypothetical protein CLV70_103453 [Pseudosporangium ferrugineum]BCJ54290.1 hypothetical protein Asp14428_57650 [Actinoplanes sp. NBRC 14428]
MTATVLDRAGHHTATAGDDAELCVAVLGSELTAYLAGADSVAQFESWFAGPARPDSPARRRLAAAAELITVFETANRTSLAAAWLREVDPAGYVPARVLRLSEGNDACVKALLETAAAWSATA